MNRRGFLAVMGAAWLSGCGANGSSDENGERQPAADASTSGPTPSSETQSFGRYLSTHEIDVQELYVRDAVVELRYTPAGETYDELSAEIGTIAGGFFRGVEEGMPAERLEATMLEAGEKIATWYAEVAWLDAYRRGEIDEHELSLRILQTLERH